MIPHTADADVTDQLRELLFYVDRILNPRDTISFWTQTRLASKVAGYPVGSDHLPIKAVPLSDAEQARLAAFLLSVFLRYRHKNGSAEAHVTETDRTFSYRVELLPAKNEQKPTVPQDDLLALPAFRQFALQEADGETTVELLLLKAPSAGNLYATAHKSLVLRITLEISLGA